MSGKSRIWRCSEARRPTQQAMRVKRIICQYVRSFRICTAFAGSWQSPAHCHHHWVEIEWREGGAGVEDRAVSVSSVRGPAFGHHPPITSSPSPPPPPASCSHCRPAEILCAPLPLIQLLAQSTQSCHFSLTISPPTFTLAP